MKLLLSFVVATAVCTASVIEDPSFDYKEGDRFFYFPGEDDQLQLVDSLQAADEDFINSYNSDTDNRYLLFTRANPLEPQYLVLGKEKTVIGSNFNSSKVTVFFAHGWQGDGYGSTGRIITEAFLEDKDVNVIALDWGLMAKRDYVTAKRGVPNVGRGLGQFVNWLTTLGVQYEKVHLVGFSLGGHLVGNAGRATGGKVQRITALDPAGPLWSYDRNRLVKTDAQYVEVIHTNTDFYGFTSPCGDADFYPNGGSTMPGCRTNTCSHARAVRYMASTVKHSHLFASRCSFLQATSTIGLLCRGDKSSMGNSNLNKTLSGVFRVNTRRNYPF